MSKTDVKTLKPVYLIYSRQKYLLNEALGRLKKKILGQALGELNITRLSAPASIEEIELALNTAGFFEQRKLVIISDAEKLSASQADRLSDYLAKPNPDVTLVLVAADKNEHLFRQAKAGDYFYEYKNPKGGQVASWVIDHFKKQGKKVNFEVASYLVQLLGDDLQLLANEIEKIALFNDNKDNLVGEDIVAVCSNQTSETIFDLVDALGQANLSDALTHLNHLFYKERDSHIFYMIIRQFRLLLKTKGLLEQGLSPQELSKWLGLPPFIGAKYVRQARHFSAAKLAFAHKVLLDTDIAYKTTSSSLDKALEQALIRILAA